MSGAPSLAPTQLLLHQRRTLQLLQPPPARNPEVIQIQIFSFRAGCRGGSKVVHQSKFVKRAGEDVRSPLSFSQSPGYLVWVPTSDTDAVADLRGILLVCRWDTTFYTVSPDESYMLFLILDDAHLAQIQPCISSLSRLSGCLIRYRCSSTSGWASLHLGELLRGSRGF